MMDRIVKFVISACYLVVDRFVKTLLRFAAKKNPGTLVVLTYHAIKPHQRSRFKNQMDMLVNIGKLVFADIGDSLPEGVHHVAVTFDDGFQNFIENALPLLLERRIPATIFVPVGYLGALPGWISKQHENHQELVMSADQLRSLPSGHVTVGSHCISHPRLTTLAPEQVRKEIVGSKSILETLMQKKVTLLSFPYNDFDEQAIEVAQNAGYVRAFSNVPTYPISRIDGFVLGRTDVSPDDWRMEFWLKSKGAYQWLPFAISAKRAFKRFLHTKAGARFVMKKGGSCAGEKGDIVS